MGTLIYKDDFGNQHILKENVEKDVAAVRITHKKTSWQCLRKRDMPEQRKKRTPF